MYYINYAVCLLIGLLLAFSGNDAGWSFVAALFVMNAIRETK